MSFLGGIMGNKFTSTMLLAFVAVSCAKEKAYDSEYKEPEMISRASIKTHEVIISKDGIKKEEPIQYMYVPMSLGTPREVRSASPFEQGDEKVVKLQWTEKGLEVLEFEKDLRHSDNTLNDTPVLTIPGDYADYRCQEDEFGDCTNAEEEVDDVTWDKKGKFTPDYAQIEVQEVNMLDAGNVEGDRCTSRIATNVVDYEISDGVINVELEKTYQVKNDWSCLWRQYVENKFPYNSFKVKFFYSIVRLDMLATPGYKVIDYPASDHDQFGFFETQTDRLEDNYDPSRKIRKHTVNRWAPNRKNGELVYHLSKNFNKPENKILKDATFEAVEIMNKGLSNANSPFKISLREQNENEKEVSPGDLRFNTIVLIEDPLANGLLGYGPSVKNPYTGEIVQAHTNMYGGVLKSIVRRVYESAVDLTEESLQKSGVISEKVTVAKSAFESLPSFIVDAHADAVESETKKNTTEVHTHKELASRVDTQIIRQRDLDESRVNVSEKLASVSDIQLEMLKNPKLDMNDNMAQLALMMDGDYGQLDELDIRNFKKDQREYGLGQVHKHRPEFFPIGGTTKVVYPELLKISDILTEKGTLKRWAQLSSEQRDSALDIILTKSWISTLVHELGHNLGLRHNFSGSHDKDNFFTKEEAKELGYEQAPAYSSVMDYSYSKYNQLRSFGKYDIAALRFAYAREVELEVVAKKLAPSGSLESTKVVESKFIPVTTSLEELEASLEAQNAQYASGDVKDETGTIQIRARLRPYEFCTDGHAGLSSTCNRFDEGTSLTEIAKFRVENYNKLYKYRNFRDGRLDFSAYDTSSYIGARNSEFGIIRDLFEEVERYGDIWGMALISQGCGPEDVKTYPSQCSMINDAKGALDIISNHFLEVLRTPDHTCAIASADSPNIVTKYDTLYALNNDMYLKYEKEDVITTCFDPVITNYYEQQNMVVVGEAGKFLNGFKGVNSDYKYVTDRAVLGTWPDKVMAMKFLFKRRWRNGSTDTNHMALVDIPEIGNKVLALLAHYVTGQPLASEDLVAFKTQEGLSFKIPYVIGSHSNIEQVEDNFSWLKKYLGMDQSGKSNLVDIALNQIKKIGTGYGEQSSEAAYNAINLASVRRYDRHMYGGDVELSYVKSRDFVYAAGEKSPIAKYMINYINVEESLVSIDKATIVKVVNLRTQAPATLSPEMIAFFNLDTQWQDSLINYAKQGAPIGIDQFQGTFGEQVGELIFKAYSLGAQAMTDVVEIKKQIDTTIAPDATEIEKSLYKYSVEDLNYFLTGKMTKEQSLFFKKQLKRLPNYTMDY